MSLERELIEEWLLLFGAVNVTELLAEGSIKQLKSYTFPLNNPETTNNTIVSFVNNQKIPDSQENILDETIIRKRFKK